MYSTQEVAEKLGISRRTVQGLIKEGKIKAQKIGRDWVITDYVHHEKRGRGRPPKKKE